MQSALAKLSFVLVVPLSVIGSLLICCYIGLRKAAIALGLKQDKFNLN